MQLSLSRKKNENKEIEMGAYVQPFNVKKGANIW
jgi:hypothetical protein